MSTGSTVSGGIGVKRENFVGTIASVATGYTYASVRTRTKPSRLRKNPPRDKQYGVCPYWGNVVKESNYSVALNFHYDRRVQNAAIKCGLSPEDYVRGEVWHKVMTDDAGRLLPFVYHPESGETYLYCDLQKTLGSQYRQISTGAIITEEQIAPWLADMTASSRQPAGEEKPIFPFTLKLDNLVSLTLAGETYYIE